MVNFKRSGWFIGIVLIIALEGLLSLPYGVIGLFIAYRLWNKNQFWRNIIVYLGIPIVFLRGAATLFIDSTIGIGIIIECTIVTILFVKCWNEFTYVDTRTSKWWYVVILILTLLIIFGIMIMIYSNIESNITGLNISK